MKQWVAILLVVGIFIAFVVILYLSGLLYFTGTESSAQVVLGSLVLLGGLVTSLVTLITVILRQSIEKRNIDLTIQAEQRLKTEAVLEAIKSFSTSSGAEVSSIQMTGILFALCKLDMVSLAFALLDRIVSKIKLILYH